MDGEYAKIDVDGLLIGDKILIVGPDSSETFGVFTSYHGAQDMMRMATNTKGEGWRSVTHKPIKGGGYRVFFCAPGKERLKLCEMYEMSSDSSIMPLDDGGYYYGD